jgi:MFS family permease
VLAPVIGPLLDRLGHGRRAAMSIAMMARGLLAWTMAGVISTAGLGFYPLALGVLVASKAYGVVRSAVVPRLLPARTTLVKANSRVTLAGLAATAVAAPIGAGLNSIGPQWPLYGAFVVFLCGSILTMSLPHKVDSARGEAKARLTADEEAPPEPAGLPGRKPGLLGVGSSVLHALQGNAGLRALSGFLTMFLAFMLREHPVGGLTPAMSLGVVVAAAGIGNALGTALGSLLKARGPEIIIATVLLCALSVVTLAAGWFGLFTVAGAAGVAGVSQALAKLSLDALIQRDVPENVRTSAFARSETTLQLAWVVGGGIGILLPLNGSLGMSVAAGLVLLAFLVSVRGLLGAARRGGGTARARVA